MDWGALVAAVAGSSVLTIFAKALVDRRKNKQDREFDYAAKLEERVEKLELRVDRFELRDGIYSSATACANGCRQIDDPKSCPVLRYLKENPIPDKA